MAFTKTKVRDENLERIERCVVLFPASPTARVQCIDSGILCARSRMNNFQNGLNCLYTVAIYQGSYETVQ